MILRRLVGHAEHDLFDLVELVYAENAAGFFAVAPGFCAKARGKSGVAMRQFCGRQCFVAVIGDECLLRGADQREVLAFKIVGLVGKERQVAGAEECLLLGSARREKECEAALDQFLLGPEKKCGGELGALPLPVKEA